MYICFHFFPILAQILPGYAESTKKLDLVKEAYEGDTGEMRCIIT